MRGIFTFMHDGARQHVKQFPPFHDATFPWCLLMNARHTVRWNCTIWLWSVWRESKTTRLNDKRPVETNHSVWLFTFHGPLKGRWTWREQEKVAQVPWHSGDAFYRARHGIGIPCRLRSFYFNPQLSLTRPHFDFTVCTIATFPSTLFHSTKSRVLFLFFFPSLLSLFSALFLALSFGSLSSLTLFIFLIRTFWIALPKHGSSSTSFSKLGQWHFCLSNFKSVFLRTFKSVFQY